MPLLQHELLIITNTPFTYTPAAVVPLSDCSISLPYFTILINHSPPPILLFFLASPTGSAVEGGAGCLGSGVFGFVEKTFLKTCRPQGNVREQRQYLDPEEKAHGISFQSLMLPNGMIGDMSGPDPGGKADSDLLRLDELNSKLAPAQEGKPFQGKVHGDAACWNMSHVSSGFNGDCLTVAEIAYNTDLSRARAEASGQVGKILQMFPFMDLRENQKVMQSPVGRYYMVAALLTNAHTACYGCPTSAHFRMSPPTLEEYFKN